MQLAMQLWIHDFEPGMHQQNRRVRFADDFFDDPIAAFAIRVGEPVKQCAMLGIFGLVVEIALFLMAKCFAVGDEKLKIPRIRHVHTGIIDLVDDSVA